MPTSPLKHVVIRRSAPHNDQPHCRALTVMVDKRSPHSSHTFPLSISSWRECIDLNCFSVPAEADWGDRLLVNTVYYQVRQLLYPMTISVLTLAHSHCYGWRVCLMVPHRETITCCCSASSSHYRQLRATIRLSVTAIRRTSLSPLIMISS